MIDEKLLQHIGKFKEKKKSDVEITDILLLNNYTVEEIKEHLAYYNDLHGYTKENYMEKYEKLQNKKFEEKNTKSSKNVIIKKQKIKNTKPSDPIRKNKDEKSRSEKKKIAKSDLIVLIAIIVLIMFIAYVVITYGVIQKIMLKF